MESAGKCELGEFFLRQSHIGLNDQHWRQALPVQCIPYKGMHDTMARELANKIISEIVKQKMNVASMQ